MAFWFRRNSLKKSVSFEVPETTESSKLWSQTTYSVPLLASSELIECRERLLQVTSEPSQQISTVDLDFQKYLSLLYGWLYDVSDRTEDPESSKLRMFITSEWTSSICKSYKVKQSDSHFELASVSLAVALWYMNHATLIGANSGITRKEEVQMCLTTAAGIFRFVKEIVTLSRVELPDSKKNDMDRRIVHAYTQQCLAEVQEVNVHSIVREVEELEHKAPRIYALAYEASKLYSEAAQSLDDHEGVKKAKKWKKYLEMKRDLYLAYSYCYFGDILHKEEKNGDSVKVLQESEKLYEAALSGCQNYFARKFLKVTKVQPEEHPYFKHIRSKIRTNREKSTYARILFPQKIPEIVPELKEKAEDVSLVAPEKFHLPSKHTLWTKDLYDSFDVKKMTVDSLDSKNKKKTGRKSK